MTQIDQSPPGDPDTPGAAEAGAAEGAAAKPAPAKSRPVPEAQGWRQLVPVLLVIALVIAAAAATGTLTAVGFVLAIFAVVMVHEGGHFLAAKLSGMKVTEYFVGFGPRLWSIRKGETEYGFKAIPLGGYVKIIGMSNLERDVDPADEPRTYRQQSYGKRMAVASAGILTHFLMAILVLALIWAVIGVPDYDKPTTTVGEINRLTNGQSPAQAAGFEVGDRIVSVDGTPIGDWPELPPYIQSRANQDIVFVVERDGAPVTLTARPAELTEDGRTAGYIGIAAKIPTERLNPASALVKGVTQTADLTWRSVAALGTIFSPNSIGTYADMVTGATSNEVDESEEAARPVSIVGVVRIADQAADSGILNLLQLFVVFNIFLAVVNVLPVLPFDGGHLAIATYERIRSRRGRRYQADVGKMMPFAAATIVLMLMLSTLSIYLDIFRPLSNPFR